MFALLTLLHSLCSRRYTPEEVEILKIGRGRFSVLDEGGGKDLKMASPLTKAKLIYKPGDKTAVGCRAKVCERHAAAAHERLVAEEHPRERPGRQVRRGGVERRGQVGEPPMIDRSSQR